MGAGVGGSTSIPASPTKVPGRLVPFPSFELLEFREVRRASVLGASFGGSTSIPEMPTKVSGRLAPFPSLELLEFREVRRAAIGIC